MRSHLYHSLRLARDERWASGYRRDITGDGADTRQLRSSGDGGVEDTQTAQVIELSGYLRDRWSYRWFAELAGTSCDVIKEDIFNCAYNHSIYQTGYRYRDRSIGHGADNDARVVSAGLSLVDASETEWHVLLRYGKLNRGGPPDDTNTLTPAPQDTVSIDVTHGRLFLFGRVDFGIGIEVIDDAATGASSEDFRGFLQWRSAY